MLGAIVRRSTLVSIMRAAAGQVFAGARPPVILFGDRWLLGAFDAGADPSRRVTSDVA